MKEFIQKVSSGKHLTQDEASSAMRMIMEGNATEAQIAGLLMALKLKAEHLDELLGFVNVMREKSVKANISDPNAIDMCGTGGDGTGTFNISTVASFVVACAGITVAKHGNRSVSSSCGSAGYLRLGSCECHRCHVDRMARVRVPRAVFAGPGCVAPVSPLAATMTYPKNT